MLPPDDDFKLAPPVNSLAQDVDLQPDEQLQEDRDHSGGASAAAVLSANLLGEGDEEVEDQGDLARDDELQLGEMAVGQEEEASSSGAAHQQDQDAEIATDEEEVENADATPSAAPKSTAEAKRKASAKRTPKMKTMKKKEVAGAGPPGGFDHLFFANRAGRGVRITYSTRLCSRGREVARGVFLTII